MHPAFVHKPLDNHAVQCHLCQRRCNIASKKCGYCGTRKNLDGTLFSLIYGQVSSMRISPIEIKGCNFYCNVKIFFNYPTIRFNMIFLNIRPISSTWGAPFPEFCACLNKRLFPGCQNYFENKVESVQSINIKHNNELFLSVRWSFHLARWF